MAVPSNSTPAPDAPLNLYQLQHLRMVAAGAVGVLPEPQALEMHGLWSDLGRRMIEAPITCPAAFAHVGFKVSRSQSDARSGGAWETQAQPAAWGSQAGRSHTSHAAKRHVPAPHEGQMEPIQ